LYYRNESGTLDRIPLDRCKDRRLYRVDTRNFGPIAVFSKDVRGFVGLRRKFGLRLDVEYHWETSLTVGTAIPWEELPDELPNHISTEQSEPARCKNCKVLVDFRKNDPDPKSFSPFGTWFHLQETACTDVYPASYQNQPLFDWLKSMEEKYLGPPGWKPEEDDGSDWKELGEYEDE